VTHAALRRTQDKRDDQRAALADLRGFLGRIVMHSRREFVQSTAAFAAFLATGSKTAWAANAPSVTDAEIRIGQTMPYSGPASAYGTIGRAEAAYFRMVNEMGGINGRKITLVSLDDGYSPPKTVEQTRKLIEEEQVAFIFGSVGTAPNASIRMYLNEPAATDRQRRQHVCRSGALSLDHGL
jgi:ABC-type branched-subunit amino acid transport system substrate-binding protein